MIKKLRIYQISLIAVSMLCIGLLAFMGITAIQKSLTLNLSFQASPVIKCQIKIGEDVVFNNETSEMLGGVSLNGNTLTFDKSLYAGQLGNDFQMTITNLTDGTAICVNFDKGNVGNASNFQDVLTKDGEAVYQVSTTGEIALRFEKVVAVNLSLSAGVTLDLEKSEIIADVENEITSYYAPMGKEVDVVVNVDSAYGNPEYSVNGGSQSAISTGTYTFTINSTNTSADLTLNIQAEKRTYTIIFNGNGATSGSMSNQTAIIGESYTLPANGYTKTGYNFTGWKDEGENLYTTTITLSPAGDSVTLYAQWEIKTFTITYNLTNCTSDASNPAHNSIVEYGKDLTLGFSSPTLPSFGGGMSLLYEKFNFTLTIGDVQIAKFIYNSTYNAASYDSNGHYIDSNGNRGTVFTLTVTGRQTLTMTIFATYITGDISINLEPCNTSGCCVAPDTMITMSDFTQKRIDQVQIGEYVLGYDFETGEFVSQKVLSNQVYARTAKYTLNFSDGTYIIVSDDHPLYGQLGWRACDWDFALVSYKYLIDFYQKDLEVGDILFSISKQFDKEIVSISIEKAPEGGYFPLYTLWLEGNHTYFSNDLLSHNVIPTHTGW